MLIRPIEFLCGAWIAPASHGPGRVPGIRLAGLILLAAETRQRDDIAEALLVCIERENWWKATTSGI